MCPTFNVVNCHVILVKSQISAEVLMKMKMIKMTKQYRYDTIQICFVCITVMAEME